MRPRALAASAWLALALALAAPASACGQRSTTRGLTLQAHAFGGSVRVAEYDEGGEGVGGGILVGYAVAPALQPFAQADVVAFTLARGPLPGAWRITHVDLGARVHWPRPTSRWVPYLEGALTLRGARIDEAELLGQSDAELGVSGLGYSGGGGALLYLRETLAADLQLVLTWGDFTEIEMNGATLSGFEVDARTVRLGLGLSWWP